MRFATLAVGATLLFAAGCVPVVEEPRPLPPPVVVPGPGPVYPGPQPARCDAAEASWAIGERASAPVIDRATYDSGARTARVIKPGDIVTQEYNPDRLSIYTDGSGRIRDLRCG